MVKNTSHSDLDFTIRREIRREKFSFINVDSIGTDNAFLCGHYLIQQTNASLNPHCQTLFSVKNKKTTSKYMYYLLNCFTQYIKHYHLPHYGQIQRMTN